MAINQSGPSPGGRPTGPGVGHHPVALASLAFQNAGVGLATIGAGGRLLTANAVFCQLVGLSDKELANSVDIDKLLPVGEALSRAGIQGEPGGWHEVYLLDAQAEGGELLLSVMDLEAEGIRLLTLVPRSLIAGGAPSRDALTGLGSPALFHDRLEHALKRAERHGHSLAIMLVELDLPSRRISQERWQRWQLLGQVTRRLRRVLREEDSLARLGEGRWGVLIEQSDTPQALHAVALRLEEAMDAPFRQAAVRTLLTLSIGIARYPEDAEDIESLMASAQLALKRSRRLGPGLHAFRDSRVHRNILAHEALLEQLQDALSCPDPHFHLMFQP